MAKTQKKEMTYLIFKRKEIEFEIPDDFPEEKIPKFSNLKEFDIWYKSQGFKPYKVSQEDPKVSHLLSFSKIDKFHNYEELNATKYDQASKTAYKLIQDINTYQHLFEGESFPGKLFSVFPENHIEILSKLIVPIETFEKLKTLLLRKFPNKKLFDLIDDHIYLDDISEQFTEFLFNEKIHLSPFNFYDSEFTNPSSFEEKEHWSEFEAPPFTARKTELLLKLCEKRINQDQYKVVIEKLNKLIETDQIEKFKVVLKFGALPKKLLEELIKETPLMNSNFKSLILKAIK